MHCSINYFYTLYLLDLFERILCIEISFQQNENSPVNNDKYSQFVGVSNQLKFIINIKKGTI